jgi:hypothetical protein
VRTTARDGKAFASKAEAIRYEQLMDMQMRGAIQHLVCQPSYSFELPGGGVLRFSHGGTRMIRYIADFRYVDLAGRTVVEDVKGVLTPDAHLKLSMMKYLNGIDVQLIGYRWAKKTKQVRGRKPERKKPAVPLVRFGLPE